MQKATSGSLEMAHHQPLAEPGSIEPKDQEVQLSGDVVFTILEVPDIEVPCPSASKISAQAPQQLAVHHPVIPTGDSTFESTKCRTSETPARIAIEQSSAGPGPGLKRLTQVLQSPPKCFSPSRASGDSDNKAPTQKRELSFSGCLRRGGRGASCTISFSSQAETFCRFLKMVLLCAAT